MKPAPLERSNTRFAHRAARWWGSAFALACAAAMWSACDGGPTKQQVSPTPGSTVDPQKPWSRLDLGTHATEAPDGGPQSAATVDPLALDDFLRAVPSSSPAPTDPNGGSLVGTDSGVADGGPQVTIEDAPQRSKKGTIVLGAVAVQTDMASAALEREARAQIYFPLVTRCRDKNGKVLPPDAVLLEFTIDVDGYITPQNIVATAVKPEHRDAAACMRRELSGISFRGPAGARGHTAQVKMTVPSID
ncbi:MAG: hypothetical protein IPK82_33450 [Polyangiaceae bacterium]|nr:hypothetical protein [Polyangiaceae bacterium]